MDSVDQTWSLARSRSAHRARIAFAIKSCITGIVVRFASLFFALLVPALTYGSEPEAVQQASQAASKSTPAATVVERLHFLIPGAAGGGWDRTARGVGQALMDSGIVPNIRYENMSGGGGGKAIAHLIETARPNMLMVNSSPIVVRALRGVFPQSFRDLTPIASVIGDYSTIVVRERSGLTNIAELAKQLQPDPSKVPIGGGSHGGTDHIFAALLAQQLELNPRDIKYIPYDTGGKAMVGLLSGEVLALSSGFGEVVDLWQQGWIRILCIGAPRRIQQAPQIPTCSEASGGNATFVNWRGFFAAPGLDPKLANAYRAALAELMHTPAWSQVRGRNGWVEIYRPGSEFTAMLEEQETILAKLMSELGLL